MKVQNAVVRKTLVALIAGAGLVAFAAPSFADSSEDYPPMMRGYGPGYGMGPGMMGGYGPGSQYGRGYGPGYGMGPGMMGGYGMGPWMMRGYGPGYGMWPGMMGGCGGYGYGYNALNLTDSQRAKIQKIQEDAARSQWEIMNKMHDAISQGWQEAQKKIDAVLTKEQREQLNRGWRGR